MLLAFDVGNTNIVLGVFKDGELIQNWRMKTDFSKSADEYGMIINQLFSYNGLNVKEVKDVIISTVVPSVLYTLQHLSQKYFNKKAIVVESGVKTGLLIKYDNPKQVGADRIVNAVAAVEKYGGPVIVIDFGTATTFCSITSKAEYLGGTIAPGIKISSDALVSKTAQLPNVELEPPGRTICRNTIESMQSGLVYGHMGMVEFIVKKMKEELKEFDPSDEKVKVVATGGLAGMVADGVECIDYVDKFLTLDGLEIIYHKNRGRRKSKAKEGNGPEESGKNDPRPSEPEENAKASVEAAGSGLDERAAVRAAADRVSGTKKSDPAPSGNDEYSMIANVADRVAKRWG